VIPLSVVLVALFNLSLNLIVVLTFALITGVSPMLTWLELPLIVGVLAVLSAGLAMLLSSLFIYFRDVDPIWEVITQALFYASPVIIPIQIVQQNVSATLLYVYMVNPLATCFQEFRHAIITHATPSAADALGSYAALLLPLGIVAVLFVLGFVVFNRAAPHVAEDL
jgi:ABC-2 type transport system permease protein